MAEAERAETAGRYAEAAAKYDLAAREAVRQRDRDHALYLSALLLLQSGNVRDGVAKLEVIASTSPATEDSAAAAYRAAAETIDHGDAERGWREMEQVFIRFPSSGVAHPAVKRCAAHVDETAGPAATLGYLKRLSAGPLGGTEVGELLSYEAAEHQETLGDLAGAHDAFLATATRWPYPFGALWDDSLWHASEIDVKLARYAHAIDDLQRMLRERETTSLTGSYIRPRMTPAAMRIAEIESVYMHDNARARDQLHHIYADYTTSRVRPEALWLEAELWRDDGDADKSCDRLKTLVSDFPDSRYVPCATDVCAGKVARPEKSEAPKWCHPYLMRPHRFKGD
jgi:tetratricopeptide (TPR) repeat protein